MCDTQPSMPDATMCPNLTSKPSGWLGALPSETAESVASANSTYVRSNLYRVAFGPILTNREKFDMCDYLDRELFPAIREAWRSSICSG